MRQIQGHTKTNATRADATLVTAIASIFFLSTPIPTAPTTIDARVQQTINGAPSTTSRLLHVGSMISNRITIPTPIPSSNADILPNNITGSDYVYSFSTAPLYIVFPQIINSKSKIVNKNGTFNYPLWRSRGDDYNTFASEHLAFIVS